MSRFKTFKYLFTINAFEREQTLATMNDIIARLGEEHSRATLIGMFRSRKINNRSAYNGLTTYVLSVKSKALLRHMIPTFVALRNDARLDELDDISNEDKNWLKRELSPKNIKSTRHGKELDIPLNYETRIYNGKLRRLSQPRVVSEDDAIIELVIGDTFYVKEKRFIIYYIEDSTIYFREVSGRGSQKAYV